MLANFCFDFFVLSLLFEPRHTIHEDPLHFFMMLSEFGQQSMTFRVLAWDEIADTAVVVEPEDAACLFNLGDDFVYLPLRAVFLDCSFSQPLLPKSLPCFRREVLLEHRSGFLISGGGKLSQHLWI